MTWNSVPHTERAMTSKLDDLGYACRRHYVQEAVIQGAEQLYHQLILESERRQNKRKRGNNDRGLQAAAVYLSFVSHHKPKTQREIAAIFDIEPKYVTQGLRIYEELLGRPSRITIYSDYVEEYSRALDLNKEQQDRIELVLERADRLKILETNTPTSTVAGCIYYVVLEYSLSIRPTDIAKRCGVSIPTITKVYDKLTKHAIDLL
jgi:transcription initiation factor TFIIIB Brf1 subunit/transcription initiation factor TFIIB